MSHATPPPSEARPPTQTTPTSSMVSAALSVGATFSCAVWGLIEGALLYRTSQFGTINEGNEGCLWFFVAAPSVFMGYLLGGFSVVVALIALILAIRARSWPLSGLAVIAIIASAALIALCAFGKSMLFE